MHLSRETMTVTDLQKKLNDEIGDAMARGDSTDLIIRRLFCFNGSPILAQNPEAGFHIINDVSEHFGIPFRRIYITGSVQTGYSYFKDRDFDPDESDLDLAIVDAGLFQHYCEVAYKETKAYSDLTKFSSKDGTNNASSFQAYVAKGYLRPDYMPNCTVKWAWFKYFGNLGRTYANLFSKISCGLYFSERFFEGKQVPVIKLYKERNK
jgi:hypothetical protein